MPIIILSVLFICSDKAAFNFELLIKISSLRTECNIKELIKVSQESGRKYMNVASAFFGESDNCKKKN